MRALRIGLVGLGKIALDQHIPAIRSGVAFELVAGAGRAPTGIGVPVFEDFRAMLDTFALDAVVLATPPAPRYTIARVFLEGGVDVLLEKPPCSTLGEAQELAVLAGRTGRVVFGAWHSRYNEAVQRAAVITQSEGIATMSIEWLENAEKWHPGQRWIWEAGGFGVFDSGMNALSIATRLSAETLTIESADLTLHEAGQQAIAADVMLRAASSPQPFPARFDWRHQGEERWNIDIRTFAGTHLVLERGGAELSIDGHRIETQSDEYPTLYDEFAHLIAARKSDLDAEPLRLVADIFMKARRL
jgi:predicted dehydrogenase